MIKKLREKRDWSQLFLAKKIGINNSVLSRIESGKRDVEDYLLSRFADTFDVTTDYLLGRTQFEIPIKYIPLDIKMKQAQGGVREQTISHEEKFDESKINIAYFGKEKEKLTEDEAQRLKEELEMFRLLKAKRMQEKKSGDKQGE